jgi:hypothetical protein
VAVTLDAEAALGKQVDGGLRNISTVATTAYILALVPGSNEPATATPGTPTASQADGDTLVAVTLPPEWVPETVLGGQNHYTIAPGSTGTWDPARISATCCHGPRLNYVLSGTYTLRSEGAVRLLREGSTTWEEIAPRTQLDVSTGDALLSQMADRFEATNTGADPVEILDGVLFAGEAATDPIPQTSAGAQAWTYHDQDITLSPQPVPPGPVTLRLRELTLAQGDVLPRPEHAVTQLAVSLDPDAVVVTNGPTAKTPYELSNLGAQDATLYVLTLEAGSETLAS